MTGDEYIKLADELHKRLRGGVQDHMLAIKFVL